MLTKLRYILCGVGLVIGLGASYTGFTRSLYAAIAAQEQQQQVVPLEKYLALQTTVEALQDQSVKLKMQLAQAPYNCIATVEKANEGKVVDPQTFKLSDKPASTVPAKKQ